MDIWTKLKRESKPILLYGMGDGAEKILSVLGSYGIQISGIFVSDDFLRDKVFHGHKLLSFSQAEKLFGSFITLVAFGTQRAEVLDNINKVSAKQHLYVPDVPVVGSNLFTTDFARNNAKKIKWVYDKLETDWDKYVYESIIRFKLTGRKEYLYRSVGKKSNVYNALELSNDAVCVDCGAFTGDTVAELLSYNIAYKAIYAIEPDEKTFKKLSAYADSDKRITCVNAAVSDNENGVLFSAAGSRGSKSADSGKHVPTLSIDYLFKGERANYIKLDVEGMEKQAINGASKTIKRHKPKMLVSCYHRSEDVFELPMQVFDIRGDYKLKIYHPVYLPAWDTAFLFI